MHTYGTLIVTQNIIKDLSFTKDYHGTTKNYDVHIFFNISNTFLRVYDNCLYIDQNGFCVSCLGPVFTRITGGPVFNRVLLE